MNHASVSRKSTVFKEQNQQNMNFTQKRNSMNIRILDLCRTPWDWLNEPLVFDRTQVKNYWYEIKHPFIILRKNNNTGHLSNALNNVSMFITIYSTLHKKWPRVYIHNCYRASPGLSCHDCTSRALFRAHYGHVRSWCDGSSDRSFMGWTHWAISRCSQCSTTGVTKAVVCVILSVGWCI